MRADAKYTPDTLMKIPAQEFQNLLQATTWGGDQAFVCAQLDKFELTAGQFDELIQSTEAGVSSALEAMTAKELVAALKVEKAKRFPARVRNRKK